jgi:hypothetical protein
MPFTELFSGCKSSIVVLEWRSFSIQATFFNKPLGTILVLL